MSYILIGILSIYRENIRVIAIYNKGERQTARADARILTLIKQ